MYRRVDSLTADCLYWISKDEGLSPGFKQSAVPTGGVKMLGSVCAISTIGFNFGLSECCPLPVAI